MSRVRMLVIAVVLASSPAWLAGGQGQISKDDRALYNRMLTEMRKDLVDDYYDRTFRGINLDQLFEASRDKVAAATTTAQAVDAVADTLFRFGDSHTRFLPPPRSIRVQYGWKMAAVGDVPLVMTVDAGSDAAAKGVAPGDVVLALNRFQPTRANLWQILHYYNVVRPQSQQHLVLRKPDGTQLTVDVRSKTEKRELVQVTDAIEDWIDDEIEDADQCRPVESDILVWRMTTFRDPDGIDPFIGKARKAKGLVLDLRGNGGGLLDGLKALVGWTFDREVLVATNVGRKGEKREVAKPRGKPFLGKLVVLVDSRCASASEVFARLVQIEKRGTVVGDRTSGKVMTSIIKTHDFGVGFQTFYGVQVTVSDTRMSDGRSLENVGVTPDEILLPTPADLAARRDPVLARAISILGGNSSAEQAGKLLPPR